MTVPDGDVTDEARRAVVAKYARLDKNGTPKFCGPNRDEQNGSIQERKGTNGKLIWRDLDAARAAARELSELDGGRPLRAYACPRSRHGHAHLTRKVD